MKIDNFEGRKAEYPIEKVFLQRWSPRTFDPDYVISTGDVMSLLEAARWAPSSNNKQPWRFMYAKKDSQAFQEVCMHLTGFNNAWVPRSAVIILALAEIKKDGIDQRDIALLGLGQACQNLVLECLSHGLHAHQFGGFLREELNAAFCIDTEHFFLSHIIAVGKTSVDITWMPLEKQQEEHPNSRKPLSDFVSELSV